MIKRCVNCGISYDGLGDASYCLSCGEKTLVENKKGESAFPRISIHVERDTGFGTVDSPGLTLRQWYAGMALQGLTSQHSLSLNRPEHLAERAFAIADAMIAEGEKP